jgi:hypothetical protein
MELAPARSPVETLSAETLAVEALAVGELAGPPELQAPVAASGSCSPVPAQSETLAMATTIRAWRGGIAP